jgi:hypothetical protein
MARKAFWGVKKITLMDVGHYVIIAIKLQYKKFVIPSKAG